MKALPAAALLALLATTAAQAADPNLGRNLAATCANCHGTNGKAVAGSGMGSLAGENKANMLQNSPISETATVPRRSCSRSPRATARHN